MKEPRVLILSERFIAGDAITGLNLFSLWKKDNLFCASRNDNYCESFSSFYLIGDKEVSFNNIFKRFNKVPKSGIVRNSSIIGSNPKSQSLIGRLYLYVVVPLMRFIGVFHKRVNYHISKEFLEWVDSIVPDYIYTSVGSYNMAQLIDGLIKARPHIRLIIHGYDDWVEPNYYSIYHACERDSYVMLSAIISHASLAFVTSDKMAEDYSKRYNRPFTVFSNPVKNISEIGIKEKDDNRITFVGKILHHNIKSIISLATALGELNSDLTLHIYSDVLDNLKTRIKKAYSRTVFHGWVAYNEIPNILVNSRILYLPISIDKQTVKFTKYSMSTKMSEYLSSGVPILYHGPGGIAMTEMLEKNNCAFVVKNDNIELLKNDIDVILSDELKTKEKLERAMDLFNRKFDIEKVASDFKLMICSNIRNTN